MPYKPADVAQMLDISVSSVRNWASWHAAHLSDTANPSAGGVRIFTETDVQVLQHVNQLRAHGLTTEQINAALDELTFPIVEATPPADEPAPLAPLRSELAEQMLSQLQRLVDQGERIDTFDKRLIDQDRRLRQVERFSATQTAIILVLAVGLIVALVVIIILLT